MAIQKRELAGAIEIGEAKITSKGQITVPGAVRKELGLKPGDRLKFIRSKDGAVTVKQRKFRSILDIARKNPIRLSEPIRDLDAAIDEAITTAMAEQEARARKNRRT
jgi:AbrB family looped-hinge helix DNA binding protein